MRLTAAAWRDYVQRTYFAPGSTRRIKRAIVREIIADLDEAETRLHFCCQARNSVAIQVPEWDRVGEDEFC